MKTAAFILASIVLFLSTQCMMKFACMETEAAPVTKSCCAMKAGCKKNNKEPKQKDCKNTRNPFMFCSGSTYEPAVKQALVVPVSVYISIKNGFKKDLFISAYVSSVWNPPEFI